MQKYNLFFNEAKLSVINYDKNQLNILRSNGRFIYEEQNDLNTCINDFLHHRNDIKFYVLPENESQLLNSLTSFFIFKTEDTKSATLLGTSFSSIAFIKSAGNLLFNLDSFFILSIKIFLVFLSIKINIRYINKLIVAVHLTEIAKEVKNKLK